MRLMHNKDTIIVFFSMLFLFVAQASFSLPSDSKEKLYISSNASLYNYKTGLNVFDGNVQVDQGSTHITADKLITKSDSNHKLSEAIAYGQLQPAHYWTLTKQTEPEIHAYAKVIRFYPLQSNVTLEQQVKVTQGENSFHGNLIHYNSADQTIIVPGSNQGRSVIVYNPDK